MTVKQRSNNSTIITSNGLIYLALLSRSSLLHKRFVVTSMEAALRINHEIIQQNWHLKDYMSYFSLYICCWWCCRFWHTLNRTQLPKRNSETHNVNTVSSLYYSKWVHIIHTQNRDRQVCVFFLFLRLNPPTRQVQPGQNDTEGNMNRSKINK